MTEQLIRVTLSQPDEPTKTSPVKQTYWVENRPDESQKWIVAVIIALIFLLVTCWWVVGGINYLSTSLGGSALVSSPLTIWGWLLQGVIVLLLVRLILW